MNGTNFFERSSGTSLAHLVRRLTAFRTALDLSADCIYQSLLFFHIFFALLSNGTAFIFSIAVGAYPSR